MKQSVRFVKEPPPIGGPQDPRASWMERLRLVIERPNEWAEVYSGTPSACHQAAAKLRLRQYHVPPGGWDFTVRSFRRGHQALKREDYTLAVLYARYLGPDAEAFTNYTAAYTHAHDAVWDQLGRRICPKCERTPLDPPVLGGRYAAMCEVCSEASALTGVEHGTDYTYRRKGCRCPDCRKAGREANRRRILNRLSRATEGGAT